MEDKEKRIEEQDVEAHKGGKFKNKAFEGEPTSEGEADEDVELHGRRKHRA